MKKIIALLVVAVAMASMQLSAFSLSKGSQQKNVLGNAPSNALPGQARK